MKQSTYKKYIIYVRRFFNVVLAGFVFPDKQYRNIIIRKYHEYVYKYTTF